MIPQFLKPTRSPIFFGLFLTLSILQTAFGADRPASPAQGYSALVREYQTAQAEFSKLYQAAKTDEEREKLRNEKAPDSKKFAARFWDLAQQNPKDPAALDALVWVTTSSYQSEEAGKALALLAKDHAASEKVANVCDIAPYISSMASGDFLRAVLEKNPKREAQAKACEGLYTYSLMAEPAQAEKFLALLSEKYSDLTSGRGTGTVGEFAKTEREHNKTFGIGQVAPEIEGEDIDGKKFKLSDYRGKVVVIDFWGDW